MTLARAQLMGQTDREVLKATGLGMRASPRRVAGDPDALGPISVGCLLIVSWRSNQGSMVSHPLPVAIKWGAYGVSRLAGRMQRKRHRHARAGLPILCVGSAAHGHDHTDDRGHLGGVFNAQSKDLRQSVYCAG